MMIPDISTILEVVLIVVKVVVVTMILFGLPLPLTWLERKVAGHIQVRLGPWRVGPHGLLQPFADMIKLLMKEDIVPDRADKFLFTIAPLLAMVPAFAVFVAIPFGENIMIPVINKEVSLYISDMNVGILYILAISGLGIYGIILGGWASNSKYSLIGGLRSSAQMISYEISISFAAIGVLKPCRDSQEPERKPPSMELLLPSGRPRLVRHIHHRLPGRDKPHTL